jgi:hypothetical protein
MQPWASRSIIGLGDTAPGSVSPEDGESCSGIAVFMKTPVRGLSRKELGETGGRAATNSSGLASAGHAQVMSSTKLVTFSY